MTDQTLQGTAYTARDKLDELRQRIHEEQFTESDRVREFVNRYVTANPEAVRDRSQGVADELVASIRSELGLAVNAEPSATQIISDQVRNLILGHAQASEDTARWAVHHAANQVMMHSGQFTYDSTDIFIDGAGMDFVFHRSYKSQGYNNGPLGINWDHNYNLWLRVEDGGEKIVRLTGIFHESAYSKHPNYGAAGFNYWVPPPGEHSVVFDLTNPSHRSEFGIQLTSTDQNCTFGLRIPGGTVYLYEQDPGSAALHRIRRIEDRFGNYLAFTYEQDSALSVSCMRKVFVNNPNRIVVLGYDALGRIAFAKDYINRVWQYTYDDCGDLIAFTLPGTDRYPGGLMEHYVYTTPYYNGELQHNLIQVYDTAGRLHLETTYGTSSGRVDYNRVTRQREGHGERSFEYEDISLATGIPAGQPDVEEDWPIHQTTMTRRNGHPVHYIYNKFGNLIAREEDAWSGGTRRRLVAHYRYNRDGALTGEITPEGRETLYLYGRDHFLLDHKAEGLTASDDLRKHASLDWTTRLGFASRLAVVRKSRRRSFFAFQFPTPFSAIGAVDAANDVIVKTAYDDTYQNIQSISHPEYTISPFASVPEHPRHASTLTEFEYDVSKKFLKRIQYPDCTRDGITELTRIEERFLHYDGKGRLIEYQNQAGCLLRFAYQTAGVKEGYLEKQILDPAGPGNPSGLNLGSKFQVNDAGVNTQITLPKGSDVVFSVNDLNQVTAVTRQLKPGVKYATRFAYCRNMRVERIERDVQDEDGQPLWGGTEVQFLHYDENDNVSREQIGGMDFSDHLITGYTYNDGDLRTTTVLPRGNCIRIGYDERRLPVEITRGAGSKDAVTVKVVYDGDGRIVEQRDGRGLKTTFTYDNLGRVVEIRDYDENNGLYRLIRHDYDKSGNPTVERVFVPDGAGDFHMIFHCSYVYNELGQRIEKRIRRFQTLIASNVAEVQKSDDVVPLSEAVRVLFFYDKGGRMISVEERGRRLDENGNPDSVETVLASTYSYNTLGWLTVETDPLGNRTETHYDKHGLVTRVDVREQTPDSPTGEEVFTTLYGYDSLDRLAEITDGLGNITRFLHDSRDAIIKRIDPLGNVIHTEYDIYGRRTAERIEMTDTGLGGGPRQSDSDIVTRLAYDANGNLARLSDARGTPTDQEFDALDRRTVVRYADSTETSFVYDGNDNVVQLQDNNGLIRRTDFDPLDNPARVDIDTGGLKAKVTIEGATFEEYEFDALERMTRARNDWSDIQLKVDSLGHVVEEKVAYSGLAQTFTLKRGYDDFGFLARLTYPSGRVLAYFPDALNRIRKVENRVYGAGYPGDTSLPTRRVIAENTYCGLRLGRKTHGNGARIEYAYDGGGRVVGIAHQDSQGGNLLTLQYLYDAAGNLRVKYEYAPGENYGETYTYDSRYQLTHYKKMIPPANPLDLSSLAPVQVLPPALPQFNGQMQIDAMLGSLAQNPTDVTFKYDKLGNRTEEKESGSPQPISYTSNTLNQYTQQGQRLFDYTYNGNLQSEQEGGSIKKYIYNYRNQIVRVTDGLMDLARYRYNALGQRIWRYVGKKEVFSIFDGSNVLEDWQRKAAGQAFHIQEQFVNESEIDSRCQVCHGGTEHYYHTDVVGSTRILTDPASVVVASYRYKPFGDLVTPLPEIENDYLFAGRPYESELGLYDFRARQYSPYTGTFLQRDPNGYDDSMNLFAYVNNNPLVHTDPEGADIRLNNQRGIAAANRFAELLRRKGHHILTEVTVKGGRGGSRIDIAPNPEAVRRGLRSIPRTIEHKLVDLSAYRTSTGDPNWGRIREFLRTHRQQLFKHEAALRSGLKADMPFREAVFYQLENARPNEVVRFRAELRRFLSPSFIRGGLKGGALSTEQVEQLLASSASRGTGSAGLAGAASSGRYVSSSPGVFSGASGFLRLLGWIGWSLTAYDVYCTIKQSHEEFWAAKSLDSPQSQERIARHERIIDTYYHLAIVNRFNKGGSYYTQGERNIEEGGTAYTKRITAEAIMKQGHMYSLLKEFRNVLAGKELHGGE